LFAFDRYSSPHIATQRLILEPLTAGHADALFAPLSDAALYTFLPGDPPVSVAALRERYKRLQARRSPDGHELWLNWAERQHNGSFVGLVEATVHADATAHVAYFVFTAFQRQGFAAEAVEAVLTHLKNDVGVREARALLDTRNEASWRLMERLGFRRARTIKDADKFKGASSDEYEYLRELH
jgi:[ribosomal protein S5]-alanine N-acetyltransferase